MSVSLAAIGLGGLGGVEVEAYAAMDDVTLVAGADVADDARKSFADEYGLPTYADYGELITEHADELDAISIVTPHTLHFEQAMACLDAGLHVYLEKPMTTDVDHAETLVRAAAKRDLVLQVGYQRHFHPAYRRIKRTIDAGDIGDIHLVSCYLAQNWIEKFPDAWRTDPSLSGGGQLYDSGSHLLDTLLWTTGTTARAVGAMMTFEGDAVDVDSSLTVSLDRDGRQILASIAVSADGTEDPSTNEGLFIWGTEGRLSFDGEVLTVTRKDGDKSTYETESPSFEELVDRKLSDFIDAVRNDSDPTVPGEFGLQVVRLTEAAYRANETGQIIPVDSGTILDSAPVDDT